jgi:hypothetical protein
MPVMTPTNDFNARRVMTLPPPICPRGQINERTAVRVPFPRRNVSASAEQRYNLGEHVRWAAEQRNRLASGPTAMTTFDNCLAVIRSLFADADSNGIGARHGLI